MEHEIIAVWTQVAQVFTTLLVGGVQCGLIWWGLKQMDKASTARNRQLDQQDKVLAELLRRSS